MASNSELEKDIKALARKICNCKDIEYTVGLPTDTPTGSQSLFRLDPSTDILYYYESDVWSSIALSAPSSAIETITAAGLGLITPTNGMIYYVTDTDVTFTSAGFWGYEEGAWGKFTLV